MNNQQIATVFRDIAGRLEREGDNVHRIRAYRRAADSLGELREPVADIAKREQLRQIRGIGKELEKKIIELIDTGTLRQASDNHPNEPSSDQDPFQLPGLDTATAQLLHRRFHIESLEDLERLARSRLLRTLPGIGVSLERTILQDIDDLKKG